MTRLSNLKDGVNPSSRILEIKNHSTIRVALYRLFSSLFQYPDMDLLNDLQVASEEMIRMQPKWENHPYADNLLQLFEDILEINLDDRKSIVNEYNRLFLIKPVVAPYETSYVNQPGQNEGMIAAEVSGIYSLAGLAVSQEMNELPDHIAVELEYMSFLCERENNAIHEEECKGCNTSQKEQREFMRKHLAKWFPKFAAKALQEAKADLLYHRVVSTTFAFLRNELDYLEIGLEGLKNDETGNTRIGDSVGDCYVPIWRGSN